MEVVKKNINANYEQFYAKRSRAKVYPTEFVVRTFLANYPGLMFTKPKPREKILDIGFGDGRNAAFLCDLGLTVSGVEITEGIVEQAKVRLSQLGHTADLRVGRNSHLPFEDNYFDYILSCHCCYYCDESESFMDNMKEYVRVIRPGGYLVASIADAESYIFKDAETQEDGSKRVKADPYMNRNGYRLHAFLNTNQIEQALSPYFKNFSFGHANNDYYGINERVFWVVCEKR